MTQDDGRIDEVGAESTRYGQRTGLRETGSETVGCIIFQEYSTVGLSRSGLDRTKIVFSRIKTGF